MNIQREAMSNEHLLVEVEELIRTAPPRLTIRHETDENVAWLGRLSAVIEAWDASKMIPLDLYLCQLRQRLVHGNEGAYHAIMTLLHQARHHLRMKMTGPLAVSLDKGFVFDYFDEVRKVIETARLDLLFVDPYLDAEFVSRFLPNVSVGVKIRLLAGKKLKTLIPAVETFIAQNGCEIEVRSSDAFHDRYILVDGMSCYQSGASFKDGARKAPTTLTQLTDGFAAIRQVYEDIWSNAAIVPLAGATKVTATTGVGVRAN